MADVDEWRALVLSEVKTKLAEILPEEYVERAATAIRWTEPDALRDVLAPLLPGYFLQHIDDMRGLLLLADGARERQDDRGIRPAGSPPTVPGWRSR